MPLHWHKQGPGCESVTGVKGQLRVYVANGINGSYDKLGSAGMCVKFQQGQSVAWGRSRPDGAFHLLSTSLQMTSFTAMFVAPIVGFMHCVNMDSVFSWLV